MATQDYAASVQGVAIRVTRLDAAGNLLNGPGDSYATSAFLRASFTPEYEEGDEITEKAADGTICVSYKAPDTLKRITMEIAICEPDPELTALMSGGLLLRKNYGSFASPDNKSIGWAAPGVGDDPAGTVFPSRFGPLLLKTASVTLLFLTSTGFSPTPSCVRVVTALSRTAFSLTLLKDTDWVMRSSRQVLTTAGSSPSPQSVPTATHVAHGHLKALRASTVGLVLAQTQLRTSPSPLRLGPSQLVPPTALRLGSQ